MKTALRLLVVVSAAAAAASANANANATEIVSIATTPAVVAVANATELPSIANTTTLPYINTAAKNGTKTGLLVSCSPIREGLQTWYYNSYSDGPYRCTRKNDAVEWSMLNAYRSGGTEGVHWKYTENVNDGACLNNWKYYSADGQSLIVSVSGRTTTINDPRRWCALPVYRSGGVLGKQWNACGCIGDDPDPFTL